MTKFNISIFATAVGGLLLSGSALAASLQPAAGEAPFFQPATATSSTLQRADVEAQAALQAPSAGMAPFFMDTDTTSTLARATVRLQAANAHPAAGEMNAQAASSFNVLPAALGE